MCWAVVLVLASYLAMDIDGLGVGRGCSRKIERSVAATAVQEAVIEGVTISVSSDNLSSVVNAYCRDAFAARGINCGVGAAAIEEADWGWIIKVSDDLSV